MRLDSLYSLRAPGKNQRWFVISAIIHVLVIGGMLMLFRPIPTRVVSYIDLGAPAAQMPPYVGPGSRAPEGPVARAARPRAVPVPSAAVESVEPAPPAADTEPTVIGEEDSVPAGTHRQLGPEYGDGRLWVRAGDAERGEVPARVGADSMADHIASVDSILARKIRAYMDTVPLDSFATRSAPKWTTEIAGQTWGIDGKWIYLGGLKIPTAILAMIPIPASATGNYDAQSRASLLEAQRRDIMDAAARATAAVEFRKYVNELRARKEMEHQARNPPPPPKPPEGVPSDTTKKKPPEPLYP